VILDDPRWNSITLSHMPSASRWIYLGMETELAIKLQDSGVQYQA